MHSLCDRLQQEPRALVIATIGLEAEHRCSLVVIHLIVNVNAQEGKKGLNNQPTSVAKSAHGRTGTCYMTYRYMYMYFFDCREAKKRCRQAAQRPKKR